MYSFVLQDWITVGGTGGGTLIQSEQDWLDMSPFQDVVAWLDVREVTGGPAPVLAFETAPAKDEPLFMGMAATATTLVAAGGPVIVQLLMGSAAVPIAQFLRWKITSGVTWDATFRILVAANAPGLQPDDENRKRLMMGG